MSRQKLQAGKLSSTAAAIVVVGIVAMQGVGPFDSALLRAEAQQRDRDSEVDIFRADVFVLNGINLQNPDGFCAVEPCGPGETLPTEPLYNLTGVPLNVTWGDFQTASARSTVNCRRDGTTLIRVRLSNLRPNAVYSLFYRTFGPDSINPFCSNEERSIVVPERCVGSNCTPVLDSRIETDTDGEARYVGEVPGCLLNPQTLVLDVIYHFNGQTYGALPNELEAETQHPAGCTTCPPCHSSFGTDAMRQAVIIQKAP